WGVYPSPARRVKPRIPFNHKRVANPRTRCLYSATISATIMPGAGSTWSPQEMLKLTKTLLRIPRCQIGRYRDDIVFAQVRHDSFHQHVERTVSRSRLESIELTSDVQRGN